MDIVVSDFSSQGGLVKTGDTLEGRYRIVRTLGTGSIGSVYLAEHLLIKRRVAIKILRPELGDGSNLDGFMTEARAAGTLGHPNIVDCTDMGFTAAGAPYIVLEYLEGTMLTDEIYRLGGLPVRRALKIATQIAAALGAAHDAGVVHRDLTSDNVYLIDRGEARDVVKVLDFGVSRFRTVPGERRQPGLAVGTLEFMSPEQLTRPEAVDRRTDIYALGVILYEMLTARRPFTDDDRRLLLHRVVNEPPPPMMLPDTPAGLGDMILSRLLAKDPAQRHASAADVQGALAALATSLQLSGPPSGQLEAQRVETTPVDLLPMPADALAPLSPPARRAPQLAWLIAAMLAAGAGGGMVYVEDQARSGVQQAIVAVLDGDAEKLAGLIDGEVRAAQLRADAVAATPILRAAIQTDAATITDMAASELIISPRPGEVLELFQLDDGRMTSMLRIPADGAAIAPVTAQRARIASDGSTVAIAVGASVVKQGGGVGGAVAIAIPLDLGSVKRRLAEHARSATLVGLGEPLRLVDTVAADPTLAISVPLASDLGTGEVALTIVPPPPSVRGELRLARLACWGLAGAMLMLFTVSLLRRSKPE